MKKRNESNALKEAIGLLETKQAHQLVLLRYQFHLMYNSLQPINLIKNTLHEAATSPDLKNNIINNAIGLTTGFLSKKILIGASHNPVKKLLGTLIQFAITNFVANNAGSIASTGGNLLQLITKYKNEKKQRQAYREIR